MIQKRLLGKSGLEVSEIGFGAWGIGGWSEGQRSYGPTEDKESREALIKALELGYNFFDTAPLYGLGHSESLLGSIAKDQRNHMIIATKVGYQNYSLPPDYSPQAIEKSLKASLTRLKTDYVDLLQLHDISSHHLEENPEILEYLTQLKQRGLIRSYGVSAQSPQEAKKIIENQLIDVIQVNFNMLDIRAITCGLLEIANDNNIGLIARTPLCFGFLTGKIRSQTHFPDYDHRSRWNGHKITEWVNKAQEVLKLAASHESVPPPSSLNALRFILSFKEFATIIPGILTKEEAQDNAQASSLGPLSNKIIESILHFNQSLEKN
jgi:aryl-alcohol dehydrogenase-like predicted oxidoreductase